MCSSFPGLGSRPTAGPESDQGNTGLSISVMSGHRRRRIRGSWTRSGKGSRVVEVGGKEGRIHGRPRRRVSAFESRGRVQPCGHTKIDAKARGSLFKAGSQRICDRTRRRDFAAPAMTKITLTPDEAALLRHIGSKVAGPRHTLALPADHRIAELVGELVDKGLAESKGYVLRTG